MGKKADTRELTYEVGEDFPLPDLSPLTPDGGRMEQQSLQLERRYFDTADRDLFSRGGTLRWETGTPDAGWLLDVPSDGDGTVIRLAHTGSTTTVPRELVDLSFGVRRGWQPRLVVTVRSERSAYAFYDADDRLVLELMDDQSRAVAPGRDAVLLTSWRQLRLVRGAEADPALLGRAAAPLESAGAKRSKAAGEVARSLDLTPDPRSGTRKRRSRTAGDVIQSYLADQDDALVSGDLLLRRGEDAIHPTRVATRRLRSTLRVFADYVDPTRAERFDAELRWFAHLLGQVRDPDVQRARLQKSVAELPADAVLGPVGKRIDQHLDAEKRRAQETLDRAMKGRRYAELLRECRRWADDPPLTDAAAGKPATLEPAVASAAKKVAKSLRAALRSGDLEDLHTARKAGKRARYAAELAHGVLGKPVKKSITRYSRLQDILGEHQDSVVAADLLRRIAITTAKLPRENGFTFGVMRAAEQEHAEASRLKAWAWAAKH